jgi:hypothetical protein
MQRHIPEDSSSEIVVDFGFVLENGYGLRPARWRWRWGNKLK